MTISLTFYEVVKIKLILINKSPLASLFVLSRINHRDHRENESPRSRAARYQIKARKLYPDAEHRGIL
jgi:hypothetical protein